MSIYIRQGVMGPKGRWRSKLWVVNHGVKRDIFSLLYNAKLFAVRKGASGRWRREIHNGGPRGAAQVTYYDAGEQP